MWSAAPWLAGFVPQTRSVLDLTARTTSDLSCGGVPAFNNVYGRGRIDALAAVSWLAGPRAAFTWSCNHLTLVCTFDGTGSVGFVNGWSWDFGDGSTGNGATVTHPYGVSGDYAVTLTVTDVNGQSHDLIQTIRVGLIADFVHQCTRFGAHLVCGFDGSLAGPAPVISWDWDFGNGTVGAGMLVSNLYPGGAGSSFNVTLTVTDTAGNTASVTRPVP
jgi:PKD repeat protein